MQDGQQLKQAMERALHSPLAKLAGGAKVNAVSLKSGGACSQETLSSPCAAVVYDVLSPKGKVVLANAKGFAVYVAPRWLVSKTTICALLTIDNGGKAPPGC
ncbi:MAG: hypothetical protein ACRDZ5_02235 [Acidimicrobiales bacterium]